jgi:hypothetical protein
VQDTTTLASLPVEMLTQIHSCVLQADPSLRSCLALEATCKHLRSTLHSNARFLEVGVDAGQLDTSEAGSFWSWIAAHGWRTDRLLLQNLELRDATPALCTHAGVLQAKAVAVTAVLVITLEPLRGLLNLAAVDYTNPPAAEEAVSLEPLAGLPALEHVNLDNALGLTTSLEPLRSMTALTNLRFFSFKVPQLDDVARLSNLRSLQLVGFGEVTCVAPLSCLTLLTKLALLQFTSLDSFAPLHALTGLKYLALSIASSRSISLEPLSQLASLTTLTLAGDKEGGSITDYDLQPLSALSRTLQVLTLKECLVRNLPSIGPLGLTLEQLNIMDCECQPGAQLASLIAQMPQLYLLRISHATAADLDAIGQHLTSLLFLTLKHATSVTLLDALTSLIGLCSITFDSCSHLSSIDSLTALTRLKTLEVLSCPQLTSLSPLTALQSLRQLRLGGCPQLVASLPASLRPLLTVCGQE